MTCLSLETPLSAHPSTAAPLDGPCYLTLQEAVAEGYGAYSTLRSWIAKGKLPAYKTGSRVKVLRTDLDALVIPAGGDPVNAAIDKVVAAAPSLTTKQTRRLRDLLGGAQ
ncbi:MAG: helix-turn-helix domain-containing protein [Propionibacteriaceae bacterium]